MIYKNLIKNQNGVFKLLLLFVILTSKFAIADTLPVFNTRLNYSSKQNLMLQIDSHALKQQEVFLLVSEKPFKAADTITLTNNEKLLPYKLIAAGLIILPYDKALIQKMHRTPSGVKSDPITETVNSLGAEGLIASLGALYLIGDYYDKKTAKLAGAAVIQSYIITKGIKSVIRRKRPDLVLAEDASSLTARNDSFPSGHTADAFAAATVLAHRYPKQKWIYYTIAAGVGYARVRKSDHYFSDVLVGAGVGVYGGNKTMINGVEVFCIKF